MTTHRAACGIVGLLVVLACAARLIHLDADPYFPTWIGYVVDEGRWSETARNLALFGTPDVNSLGRLHLILSPGYQAVNYLAFQLFGVDFWSARAFAAVSGIIVVLTVLVTLRRHVTTFAMALGIVILGFETNLLAESRMALPEMPAVLGILLAFLVLVLGRKTPWNAFLASVFATAAVTMKATSLLVVPILPIIILLAPHGGPARARVARTLAFLTGFALLVVAGSIVALALGLLNGEGIAGAGRSFLAFLSLADPYTVVMRFFDSSELEARNLMLLGAWFCSWIWFRRDSNTSSVASELYLASGVWAAWWLVVWSGNNYLPGRYVVHFVVPATIHLMAGLSLAGRDTLARIAAALNQRRGLARAASLAWLVLPTAILIATVLAGLAEIGGWNVSRVSVRSGLIVALAGLMAAVAQRTRTGEGMIGGFLILPVLMTLLWLAGRELGVFHLFWQFDSATSLAVWTALLGATVAACFVLTLRTRAPQWHATLGSCVIVSMTAIFLAQAAPPVLAPTYSIRDASRNLEQHFSAALEIRTLNAASLFLENKLKYRELSRDDKHYDGVVIFEHSRGSRAFLESGGAANLVRVQTYPVTINPRYETDESKFGPASIAVYKTM